MPLELLQETVICKAINRLTPPYLTDSIVMASEAYVRNTRVAISSDVYVSSNEC